MSRQDLSLVVIFVSSGLQDILDGETEEETLQRRIEEGKIGKGKTLRRWKNTEAKVGSPSLSCASFLRRWIRSPKAESRAE